MAALIAALYVVLTLLSNAVGLASGVVQLRISEALTILPVFTWAAVPGLTIGCIIANMITGCAIWDIVFGSAATFMGALGTYFIGKRLRAKGKLDLEGQIMLTFPPIIANMIVVPKVLQIVYGSTEAYWFILTTVGAGEVISCGVFGVLLYRLLARSKVFE